MPQEFPDVWLDRVVDNLDNTDQAPFINIIPEIDQEVNVIGEGTTGEQNIIYVNDSDFEPSVLINNSTYPLTVQSYVGNTIAISLDKLQTLPTSISDDDKIGASYKKIDLVTGRHTSSILKSKYSKAVHALAPSLDTPNTPVFEATGGPNGLSDGGRPRLTYEDLVEFQKQCEAVNMEDIVLVLNPSHWADLMLDRERNAEKWINYNEGKFSGEVLGIRLFKYKKQALYFKDPSNSNTYTKRPFGAAALAGDKMCSVAFDLNAVAKKTGLTKQYFADAAFDPEEQTNKLSYRHYFICVPFKAQKIAAIV